MKLSQDELLTKLISFHDSLKTSNNNIDVEKIFNEYLEWQHQNHAELQTEPNGGNDSMKKIFLEELIRTIFQNQINSDIPINKKKENVELTLQSCIATLNSSQTVQTILSENKNAKVLLDRIRNMLQSNVSREEKESMRKTIENFQESSIKENKILEDFDLFTKEIFDTGKSDCQQMKLENGWNKNIHELEKRNEKMNLFHKTSSNQLEHIEKEIEKYHNENKEFRKILNKTSDQITEIIQKLKSANHESDFLNTQINIIDSTIDEMEKCKQKTEFESLELAHLLEEKHSKLQGYLKCLDNKLEDKANLHNQYISTDKIHNDVIDELTRCFADFEEKESEILSKYSIQKNDTSLDLQKKAFFEKVQQQQLNEEEIMQQNSGINEMIDHTDIEEKWRLVEKLQEDKVNLLKEKEDLEEKIDSLTVDVEDLYNVNSKLNTELNNLKIQINGPDYIPGTCVIPTKRQGVTVRFPIIEEVDENVTSSAESLIAIQDQKNVKCLKCEDLKNKLEIYNKHEIKEEDLKILEDKIISLKRTVKNLTKRKDDLEKEIDHLTSNKEVYESMAKISKTTVTNNESKEKGDNKTAEFENLESLQLQIDELQTRNEQLLSINKKAQAIFEENEELLEENTNLQDEIENLENIIKEIEFEIEEKTRAKHDAVDNASNNSNENTKNSDNEKEVLEKEIENLQKKIENSTRPKILYTATKDLEILQLKPKEDETNKNLNIELQLHEQFTENKSLHKQITKLKEINNNLKTIYENAGLSSMKSDKIYEVTLVEKDDNKVFASSNIKLNKETKDLIDNTIDEVLNSIPDDVVDELSSMLMQSYQDYDKIKSKQKELENEIERLNLELNYRSGFKINNTEHSEYKYSNEEAQTMKMTLENMGIAKLEYGVMYTVHFQALTKSATSRRASKAYQNSCRPMKFDDVKNIMKNIPHQNKTLSLSRSNNEKLRKVDENLENVDFSIDALVDTLEKKTYTDEKQNINSSEDYEKSLRKIQRQNEELKKANRMLKAKLLKTEQSKSVFKNNAEDVMESVKEDKETINKDKQSAFDISDLEDAYKLSEANCVFLEKRCIELEKKFKTAELQIDQEKLNATEFKEEKECISKELYELNQKNKEYSKTVIDLKKDIDYLEKDLEYYKQLVIDNGIEVSEISRSPVKSTLVTDSLMLLKADLENVKNEKQQLLMNNESLHAKLKFTETEKKYISNQLDELLKERNKSMSDQTSEIISTETSTQDKKGRSDSSEIRQVGLAKKYKQLQIELRLMSSHIEELTVKNSELTKQNTIQDIELQTLKTQNNNLTEKIIDLEDRNPESAKAASLERKRKTNMASKVIQHWSNLLEKTHKNDSDLNSIKEDTILLAHENEEIKQSNNLLLQRNSELRKVNLSATNMVQQIELLKEKLNTVENENTVLKIENLNLGSRKSNLERKFSRQYELSTLHLNVKTNKLNKSTQTKYDFNSENMDDLDLIAEIEELKFIIQDLTKRNSEGKTRIYDLEKTIQTLEDEREEIEKLNEKLLSRNSDLKRQLEEPRNISIDSSAETNNPTLGLSLTFKDNILNDYEKIELQEENNSLKYENKTLKKEVEKFEELYNNQIEVCKSLERDNGKLDEIKNELILILKEVKDKEFVDSLLKSLHIPIGEDVHQSDMEQFLVHHKQPITETSESGGNILADGSSLHTEKVAVNETVDNEKLLIENTFLKKQIENYKNMVEHLERQLLQSNFEKSKRNGDEGGSDVMRSESIDQADIYTSTETQNETIDELFQVKFLLESSNKNDVQLPVINEPDVVENANKSSDESSDNELSYEKCIEEGELTSEFEDIMKSFNENSVHEIYENSDENPDFPDDKYEEDKPSPVPIPIKPDTEIAIPISSVNRFRSKEQLENAVLHLESANKELFETNEELTKSLKNLQNEIFKINNEKDVKEKEIEILHKSITDSVFLLDEQKNINTKLNIQISSLNEHLSNSQNNINDLNNLLSNKIEYEEKLENDIEEKLNEINKLQKQQSELEIVITDQDVTIDNLDKKYAQLLNDYESLIEKTNERELKIEELLNEIKILNETVNIYQIKTSENDEIVNELKIQLELQAKESYEITELNNTNEDALVKTKDELKSLTQEYKSILKENTELKEKQKILEESASDLVEIIQEFEKKDKELENLSKSLQEEKEVNLNLTKEIKIEKQKYDEIKIKLNKEINTLKEKIDLNKENIETKIILEKELKKLKLNLAEKENLIQVLKERASSIIPFELRNQENQFQLAEAELKTQLDIKEDEIGNLKEKLSEKENVIAMYEAKYSEDDVIVSKAETRVSDERNMSEIPMIKISEDENEKTEEVQRTVSLPTQLAHNYTEFGPSYSSILLSDVSDDESFFDVLEFNEHYITKLKEKIKTLREKLRDKNKTIKNQNVDLDNFLEDIRCKDKLINQLKSEIKLLEETMERTLTTKQDKDCQTMNIHNNSLPDHVNETQFSISTLQCSSETSKQIDYYVIPENSFDDLKELRGHVENLRKVRLHDNAHALEDYILTACKIIEKFQLNISLHDCNSIIHDENLTKLKDLTKTSKSESDKSSNHEMSFDFSKDAVESLSSEENPCIIDQRIFSTPVILKSPGKTVQQIRHDNEKLVLHNNELKLIKDDLENDISQYSKLNEKQASEISLLKEQIQQLEITIVKIKNEKDLEIIKAVDNKEKELREFYFKDKEETQRESFDDYLIEKDEIIACKDPTVLLDRIERMNEKLRTAENQIEKDWIIIEGQGVQLENLHQQFIEQRDENHRNCQLLQITDKELYNKEQRVDELEHEINEKNNKISQLKEDVLKIKASSRSKEEELGHLLIEKEEGIEKLHSMISELEKSLNNSQKHIEGILSESMEKREKENEKTEIINNQEKIITTLKNDIEEYKTKLSENKNLMDLNCISKIFQNLQEIKNKFKNTRTDVKNLFQVYEETLKDISDLKVQICNKFDSTCLPQANGDVVSEDCPQTSEYNEKNMERDKTIERLKGEIEKRDEIYQLQLDTLIKSLAGRSNVLPRTTGKTLLPTMDLSKASSRLGSSEFLKVCLNQLNDVERSSKSCEEDLKKGEET